MDIKEYRSNEEGKREFVDEVIRPLVHNEGHFSDALYVSNDRGEYILIYDYGKQTASYTIDITCDSISAICQDFIEQFRKIVRKEIDNK